VGEWVHDAADGSPALRDDLLAGLAVLNAEMDGGGEGLALLADETLVEDLLPGSERRAPFLLSGALVVVAAMAAGFSFFSPSLLTGAPVAIGCLRGTALVILAAGLPVLVAAMTRTAHGSARGLVVWLGTLA
jgi:hypothetical protein